MEIFSILTCSLDHMRSTIEKSYEYLIRSRNKLGKILFFPVFFVFFLISLTLFSSFLVLALFCDILFLFFAFVEYIDKKTKKQ